MVVVVQYRRLPLKLNVMEQMYGIDLGLSSFAVSFFDVQGKSHQLKQVKNTVEGSTSVTFSSEIPAMAFLPGKKYVFTIPVGGIKKIIY